MADDGGRQLIAVPSRVVVNNAESYIACCLRRGLGLIQIPRFDVQDLLEAGELVEVMPAHRAAPMPVHGELQPGGSPPRRLAVVSEWFEELMRRHLEA